MFSVFGIPIVSQFPDDFSGWEEALDGKKRRITVLIESRGGVIQAVYSEQAGKLEVVHLDWDEVEGAEAGEAGAHPVAELQVDKFRAIPRETAAMLKKYWDRR